MEQVWINEYLEQNLNHNMKETRLSKKEKLNEDGVMIFVNLIIQ